MKPTVNTQLSIQISKVDKNVNAISVDPFRSNLIRIYHVCKATEHFQEKNVSKKIAKKNK